MTGDAAARKCEPNQWSGRKGRLAQWHQNQYNSGNKADHLEDGTDKLFHCDNPKVD
jgi:hypothetical protein